jgi:hypothetical protein
MFFVIGYVCGAFHLLRKFFPMNPITRAIEAEKKALEDGLVRDLAARMKGQAPPPPPPPAG